MSDPIDIRGRSLYSVDQFSVSSAFADDLSGILISGGEVGSRVDRMREEMERYYGTDSRNLLVMPVMKGAYQFCSGLVYDPRFRLPFEIENIESSRYGESGSSSENKPKIHIATPERIRGKDVLIVEDIIDQGPTLEYVASVVKSYEPSSMSLAVLLDKPERRLPGSKVSDYFVRTFTGFIIPNLFVVGYGLDFKERYRSLQHIAVLKPEMYS